MSEQAVPAPTPEAAPHHTSVGDLFHRKATPRLEELQASRPAKVAEQHVGLNGKIALFITTKVGTMVCAYIFCMIAFIGAYAIVSNNNTLNLVIILISQTFLQLVLLPIIIVGQNIQGKAADKRAEDTYKDAEAILHECTQLQEHLQAQDKILDDMITHLHKLPQSSSA